MNWTSGYVADIDYTFGYYQELNPLRVKLAFLNNGLAFPEVGAACELGFGQGMSANIHAAATMTHWYGTDFNPSQAAFASDLAAASEAHVQLFDEAFAEFCNRQDLPSFDYIGLHGIWSWISDENRSIIVNFIRRKLKVGGVLYISYNTLPGWAAFAPMRHLMTQHAAVIGAEGHGIVNRIDGALDFAEKLLETNPLYARANPHIADRVKKLKQQNREYLAHEYFNKDWHPMHFATMGDWLSSAKLSYACSAHYLDHINVVNLTTDQQGFLNQIPDATLRESTRDFMVNQQFRKDYWVKGLRKLSALEQAERLRSQRVILAAHRSDISLKVTGALGEATMAESVYGPILDAMADHKVKTIGQLEQVVASHGVLFAQLIEALMILIGIAYLMPVQDETTINKSKKQTDRLNAHIIDKSRGRADISYLASPVTGGGIPVGRFQQLFLIAIGQGKRQPIEWADVAWHILSSQRQRISKEGKTLETTEENIAELTTQAELFAQKQLPILKALQIV